MKQALILVKHRTKTYMLSVEFCKYMVVFSVHPQNCIYLDFSPSVRTILLSYYLFFNLITEGHVYYIICSVAKVLGWHEEMLQSKNAFKWGGI